MRVTNSMMIRNMLDHLETNMGDLNNLNEQLSSGKVFQMPSDAPIKVSDSMNYKSQLNRNEQFQRNVGQANNWLGSSESALKNATKVIQRARELTIYTSSDTMTPEDRATIAKEMKELRDELVDISREKLGNDYIFSGQNTNTEPIKITDNGIGNYTVDYVGDHNQINRRLNENVSMNINLNAADVFKSQIETLNNVYEDLETGATGDQIADNLDDFDATVDKYAAVRAQVGAKMKRTTNIEDRLNSNNTYLKQIKSENEDIDLAKVITDLKMEETVYRASLASGSRIMQQSLVDFIR